MRFARFVAGAACLLLVCPRNLVRADKNTEVLEKVRAAHAAAWKAIRSLSCEVEITHFNRGLPVKSAPVRVKYWQQSAIGDKSEIIRCIEESETHKRDTVIDGPVQWNLDLPLGKVPSGQERSGTIEPRRGRLSPDGFRGPPVFGDPWELALFRFEPSHLSFDEFLAEARERVRLKLSPSIDLQLQLQSVHSADLVHIRFARNESLNKEFSPIDPGSDAANSRQTVEFWFDPRANFLVRKQIRQHGAEGNLKGAARPFRYRLPYFGSAGNVEHAVTRFIEHQPGIFFPEAVKRDTRNDKGEVSQSSVAVFSNVKINEPIPDEAFRFRFPPGILVTDHVTKTYGRTDADGELTLPPKNDKGQIMTHGGLKSVGAVEPPAQPREQPLAWFHAWLEWWWLFPLLVALMVVGKLAAELRGYIRSRFDQSSANAGGHGSIDGGTR